MRTMALDELEVHLNRNPAPQTCSRVARQARAPEGDWKPSWRRARLPRLPRLTGKGWNPDEQPWGGPGRAVPHVVPENGQTKILSLFYHGRCFRESRFSATQAYSPSSRPLCHCDKNKMISSEISEKFEGLESVSPTSEQPLDLAAAG